MSPKETIMGLAMMSMYQNNGDDEEGISMKSVNKDENKTELDSERLLENYLINNGLKEKFDEVKNKIENMKRIQKKSLDLKKGIDVSRYRYIKILTKDLIVNYPNYQHGDIMLCQGRSSSSGGSSRGTCNLGFFIPGYWKHTGLVNKDRIQKNKDLFILSASDDVYTSDGVKIQNGGLGGAVGYETSQKWSEEADVSIWGLKNVNDSQRKRAVNYAIERVGRNNFNFFDYYHETKTYTISFGFGWLFGRPIYITKTITYRYLIPANKNNEENWYCSKFVYKSWLDAGVNIEYSQARQREFQPDASPLAYIGGIFTSGGQVWSGWGDHEFVTPQNIADSEKDNVVYYKTNWPAYIKVGMR